MIDLFQQFAIVDAECQREISEIVSALFCAFCTAIVACAVYCLAIWFVARNRDRISRFMAWVRSHPISSSYLAPSVVALVVYASTKAVVPSTQQCDYNFSGAPEPESGVARYCYFAEATNGVEIAMNGGITTNTADVAAGQFYLEYSPTTYGGTDEGDLNYGFYVRDSVTSNWIASVTDSRVTLPSSLLNYHGRFSHLPGRDDPRDYRYWFIGEEEDLPEVIVEGGVGIVIDSVVITANGLSVSFHPADEDLKKSARSYFLQTRVARDGILGDWKTIAVLANVGKDGGTFNVEGFTVGEYREYRIYADKEIN